MARKISFTTVLLFSFLVKFFYHPESIPPARNGKRRWLACVFRADRAIAGETRPPARMAGEAPALRCAKPSPFHRRARACPSPCLDRNERRPWSACVFRADRTIAGDRPPRYGPGRGSPRHAPVREQVLLNDSLLKVRRTLMSIAHADSQVLKVR